MQSVKVFGSKRRIDLNMMFGRLLPNVVYPRVDLAGKTAVVTGANVGIGYAIALELASQGARVVLACRDPVKAEKARESIIKASGSETVEVEILDCASMESVKDFLARWAERKSGREIDILVNNAGLCVNKKSTTVDGFETIYQVNYLSSFLLTIGLLHQKSISPTARIIQIASIGLYASDPLDPADLSSSDVLGSYQEGDPVPASVLFRLYTRSKASQTVFTVSLQERLAASSQWKDVVVQSCHPGWVNSTIWGRPDGNGSYGLLSKVINVVNAIIGISTTAGAGTPLFLALSEEAGRLENRGKFWDRSTYKWLPAWILDHARQEALWLKWSEEAEIDASVF